MTDLDSLTAIISAEEGTYVVDPVHSGVHFVARHLIGSKVRGTFKEFTGTITIADPLDSSFMEGVAQVASIDTGQEAARRAPQVGGLLRSGEAPDDLLVSNGMTRISDTEWKMSSNLTVRGVTKPVTWDLEYLGSGLGIEADSTVAAFSATAEIDRRDFEVSFNHTLADMSLVVGNKVRLEVDVEARLETVKAVSL